MSLFGKLKRWRNGLAGTAARMVSAAPIFEKPAIKIGRALGQGPVFCSLYREFRTELSRLLTSQGRDCKLTNLGGIEIRFSISHFTMHGFWFQGIIYEEATLRALKQKLRAGSTFVDIGSNAGYFSVIAGMIVGAAGKVHSFEPNPAVFARLQRHVTANHLETTVESHQLALSDADLGAAQLFVPINRHNDGLASILPFDGKGTDQRNGAVETVSVACTSFDCFAARLQLTAVDLMKIDVEGAEDKVINGMREFLSRHPPKTIILETPRDSDAFKALKDHGYSVRLLDRHDSGNGNYLFEHASFLG